MFQQQPTYYPTNAGNMYAQGTKSSNSEQMLTQEFYDALQSEMIFFTKSIEMKLESVRRERDEAVNVIQKLVKTSYNNGAAIIMYGSMASGLAIDSSDVDLAITGLCFKGTRERQLSYMRTLYEKLEFIKTKQSIKFIESAKIPVIKLVIDL